jgi:hypothetical protein
MSLVNRNKVNMGSIVIHAIKQHMEKTGERRKYQNYPNLGVGARGISNRNRIYSKAVCASFSFAIPNAPTNVELLENDSTTIKLLITCDDKYAKSFIITLTPLGAGDSIILETSSKTVTIADLPSYAGYNIRVRSSNPAGNSAEYDAGNFYTTIAAPKDLSVTIATTTSFTIQFTPGSLTGVLYYIVSYGSTSTDISGNDLIIDEDKNISYVLNGLSPGTLYTVGVAAVGSTNGVNRASTYVKVTQDTLTAPPTNLVLTSISTTSIGISYAAPSAASTIDMYRITYGIYGQSTTTLEVSSTVTSYTLSGLTPNTNYQVSVVTNNKNGASDGNSVAVTNTKYTLPLSPTLQGVTNVQATVATINFTVPENNTGLTYSLVYYPTTDPLSSSKITKSITSSPYEITDLLYPVDYTVELNSVNSTALTTSSIIATTSFKTLDSKPTAPTSLKEEGTTTTTIKFSYKPPVSGTVDNYIIKYMNVSSYTTVVDPPVWENALYTTTITVPYDTLEYTIANLEPGIAYYIRVYAFNEEYGTSTQYATFYALDGETETTVKTD